MLKAVLAGMIGGFFLFLTSIIPGVNALNACCGVWFLSGGMVAAYAWTRLNDGRASFFYGLLSGFLAGLIYTGASVGFTGLLAGGYASMAGQWLSQNPTLQQYPDDGLTPEQWLDVTERIFTESETVVGAERTKRLQELQSYRQKLAQIRQDPASNAKLERGMAQVHSLVLALKEGKITFLVWFSMGLVGLLGMIATVLSTLGGFLGGLIFGGEEQPVNAVPA